MTGDALVGQADGVATTADLGRLLRALRRREARERGDSALTYRELATKTGWSVAAIGEYFAGTTLPPTDRLDVLIQLLGAVPAEQRAIADARDRVEEARRPAGSGPTGAPPRQLPADVYGFTGRAGPLAALDGLLIPTDPGSAVVISAVSGMAGVGKTALAVHWAHRVADRFPDGQLYVDLRGHSADPPGSPLDVLGGFLRALGVRAADIPSSLAERAASYRTRLVGRRVLVVLDNARSADQVRPLLPGGPSCLVVVTSRDDLAGLVARDGARRIALDVLTGTEAHELLRTLVGVRVGADPVAAESIVDIAGRLPLALRVVAARAQTRPDVPLADLVADLRAAGSRLEPFAGPDGATNLRTVFSWSYRALGEGAARLFRLLGVPPGAQLGAPAAASLLGVPPPEIGPLLDDLARAHLVHQPRPGRYAMHDLLRAYATELARPDERAAATDRLLDHYVHSAFDAQLRLDPVRRPIAVAPAVPGVTPERFADLPSAMAWFTVERRELVAAVRHAADSGRDTRAWQLAWTLTDFLDLQGHWHDLVTVQRIAQAATRRLADRPAEVRTHNGLAHAYARLGRHEDARTHYARALDLCRALGDAGAEARAELNLCLVQELLGEPAAALRHAQRAYALHRDCGNRAEEANALNAVGWLHAKLGDLGSALSCCQQALALLRAQGYAKAVAATLDSLGYVHRQRGEYGQAVECYRESVTLLAEAGDRYHEAEVLVNLGEALRDGGEPGTAREAWSRALRLMVELDQPAGAERIRALLAT